MQPNLEILSSQLVCLFVCVGVPRDGSLNLVLCSIHLCVLQVSKFKPCCNISNAKSLFEKF